MDNHAARSPASAEDPHEAAHEFATLLQHPRQAKPTPHLDEHFDEQENHEGHQHHEEHHVTEEEGGTNTNSNLEDVAREVAFSMEHKAPAHAGETTATAVSLYSASTAIGVRKRQSGETPLQAESLLSNFVQYTTLSQNG